MPSSPSITQIRSYPRVTCSCQCGARINCGGTWAASSHDVPFDQLPQGIKGMLNDCSDFYRVVFRCVACAAARAMKGTYEGHETLQLAGLQRQEALLLLLLLTRCSREVDYGVDLLRIKVQLVAEDSDDVHRVGCSLKAIERRL